MRQLMIRVAAAVLAVAGSAAAARADVCIAVDSAHDTFSPADRAAAVLLVGKQFELAGERVAGDGCPNPYTLSHIMLGNRITVTLAGPLGRREGEALGMDDLPALYSQMVRSLVTGRPMTGFNVVDRTNVTVAQSSHERVQAESLWYARLGYGGVFGDQSYGGPAMGLGYRVELDSFGVDVSFLNFQERSSSAYYTYGDSAFSGSMLKLQGLYFHNPKANSTPYLGAGVSWGGQDFGEGWHGSGLQGELTAGYELLRASSMRTFLQFDATVPFYDASRVHYPLDPRRTPITTEHRLAPSLVMSVGIGWGRGHRR